MSIAEACMQTWDGSKSGLGPSLFYMLAGSVAKLPASVPFGAWQKHCNVGGRVPVRGRA